MKDLIVMKADLSRAEETYNVLLKCSDETNFLNCSARERVENGFTLDKFRDFMASSTTGDNAVFICLYNHKVIGMLGLHCETRERSRHRVSLGINVLKDYWGMGAGSLLMRKAVEHFNSVDYLTKLELEVRRDNTSAVNLYKKFGFKVEGELKSHFCVDSKYYSAYRMAILKEEGKYLSKAK